MAEKELFSGYSTDVSSLHINLIYDYVKIFSVMFILLLLGKQTFFCLLCYKSEVGREEEAG